MVTRTKPSSAVPVRLPADLTVPESSATPFYPALDGLRTYSILAVFLVHYLPALFPLGWYGVQVFFVLSGFLITGILYDTRNQRHRYRNFYARRALRIFPLYYGFLGVLALIAVVTHGHGPEHFWIWFVYGENFHWLLSPQNTLDFVFIGTHGFAAIGHLWSLAVEEQFYFLWPPVVFLLRDRQRLMLVCGLGVAARIALAIFCELHLSAVTLDRGFIYHMLPTQADAFLMGGFLALWLRGAPQRRSFSRAGFYAAAALFSFGILLAVLRTHPAWLPAQDIFYDSSAFQSLAGTTLANLVSAFLILAVIQPGSWAHHLCNPAPLRSLGRVSYGFYVFHLTVILVTRHPLSVLVDRLHLRGLPAFFFVFTLTLALTIALSYLSFNFFEKPFLRLKNRFTAISSPGNAAASAHPIH